MGALITVLPVFFPILAGICLLPVKFKERKQREQWVLTIVVLNAIFALFAIWSGKADAFTLFHFSDKLSLELRMDGLSKVFGTMVSVLWILTTIYGFEYMTHEGHEDRFFAFFTMTFGVVLGIAFSGNFLTMYLFYEFLTLVTLPLVMHAMDNKARHAGKMYILYMMFGAALAFIGFVFVYCYGTSIDFVPGGVLNPILVAGHEKTLQLVFIAAFFGFGVKAAVFPLAAKSFRGTDTCYSAAPCGSGRKIRYLCHHSSDLLQLWHRFSGGYCGTECYAGGSSHHHCVWFHSCPADTAH